MLEEMTLAEMEEAVRTHGTPTQAATALGLTHGRFIRRLRYLQGNHPTARNYTVIGNAKPAAAGPTGRSLQEFRQSFDKTVIVPAKIREGLEKLGNGWDYEPGFAKIADVSLPDLYAFRAQFEDYIVLIRRDGKRAWAGTPKIAAQMREMLR